jgi:hypothetical protein
MKDYVWEGISLMSVVLGFIGAVLGVSYMPAMGTKQLAASLVAGVVCAALMPSLVASALASAFGWTLPIMGHHVLALFFGIGGMFIIPGAIVFWQTAAKNPLGVWDWIRGKGPPPPPAVEPPKGGSQ